MAIADKYVREGHPAVEELIAEQAPGSHATRDLLGDFWPAEESIDDFLTALREWRGHQD